MAMTMAVSQPSSRSFPAPRYGTRRRPERPTHGGRLAKVADLLGQPFMPWQRLVADVGSEYDPETGIPFYREVMITVPRQHGKTTLFLSWQIDRCVNWGSPQRMVFTAQDGVSARQKWVDELFPLIEQSRLDKLVAKKTRSAADTSISWKTGSIIRVASTSASTGHSKTLHGAVLDEIWEDTDDRREQGLRPAMITVPDAQVLVCSTAGTNASTVFNRKVQAGRLAVGEDSGRGIAYFEWSAPDDWDPDDLESYFDFMPALCPSPPCRCDPDRNWKHTITMEAVQSERDALEAPEFRRAYGNRPTGGADLIIPTEVWHRVCDEKAKPAGPLRFGLDVAEDRSSASIVAFGDGVCELVKKDQGLAWVVKACNKLTADGSRMGLDFGGPAGVFADQINNVDKMQGREVVQACGAMFDAIVENRITFRAGTGAADPFTAAIEGAVKKQVGDQWVWSRKASLADVTPLMAATIAARPSATAPTIVGWA